MTNSLPVYEIIPKLKNALATNNNVVLQAPPGAGKTTIVPLELLKEKFIRRQKILMLEPRRLAARSAAHRMAGLLNQKVGETVGYRVKMESKVGPETKIEVVTERILIRRIQNDPELKDIDMIIFDEFHERSIDSDLGLALALDIQQGLRDDLKILVMSATLDGQRIAELLGDAPIITSKGRSFPVQHHYLPPPKHVRLEDYIVSSILRAIKEEPGSILVFLPGAGEIKRTKSMLEKIPLNKSIMVCSLFGMLSFEEQDRAIRPAPSGQRKIVLATAIAETSLTIEGIRIVIDCGLQRQSVFDPRSGMASLETVSVSKASADQRAGRAGRIEAGVCYRLWSDAKHRALIPFNEPEIKRSDLVPLVLDLAAWGIKDPAQLTWLDQPDITTINAARELLYSLGALDKDGRITDHGSEMSRFPMHPRLAHMVLKSKKIGFGWTALLIAALMEEKDVLRLNADLITADIKLRLEAIKHVSENEISEAKKLGINVGSAKKVLRQVRIWEKQFDIARSHDDVKKAGCCLAIAFPDRIGIRRDAYYGNYLLSGGRGGRLKDDDPLGSEKYIAVGTLDKGARDARIFLAASITKPEIEELYEDQIYENSNILFDERTKKVVSEDRRMFMKLPLGKTAIKNPDPEIVKAALMEGIKKSGLEILPWSEKATTLRKRVLLAHDDLPDMSDETLLGTIDQWLGPYLDGRTSIASLADLDMHEILKSMLSYDQNRLLDVRVPAHLTVPSGSNIAIDYSGEFPVLAVKLQEMFGATETPTILGGTQKLTIHLLSPAQRPLQITTDLAGFWQNSYPDIKKEMKGRYPKHPWPDDPLTAFPTRRTK